MKLSCQIAAVAVFAVTLTSPSIAQVAPTRSASVDVAALSDREIRVGMEAIRTGAFSLNVMFASRDNSRGMDATTGSLIGAINTPGTWNRLVGREFSLDVGPRVYTRVMRAGPRLGYSAYAGLMAGFHYRDAEAPPMCASGGPCPLMQYVIRNSPSAGIEPIGEAGVRFTPGSAVVIDAGMRARVITFSDPVGNYSVGEIVPRMSVSVGVTW